MKRSKLIDFLRTFEARDFRRFREYLASPYFNKREDLQKFYAVLSKFAPDFPDAEVERKKLWATYADNAPFDSKAYNYLTNFLLQHAENYIANESFQLDATNKYGRVLPFCLEKGLEKHYRSVYQRAQKALAAEPYRDANWHLKAWRLAHLELGRFYSSYSRRVDTSINVVMEHLDTFYLDTKLELGGEVLNLNQILREEFDTSFIPELLEMVDKRKTSESIIEIRRLILNILQDPKDLDSFYQLRDLLPLARRIYPAERVAAIFTYAQNFCIRRIKAGDSKFERTLFRIYKESIDSEVMFENGLINPGHFKNVCSIALRLEEYQWTEMFITEHQNRIEEEYRATAIAYNLANLHYHQKNYSKALRTLHTVEFNDVFYALGTRRIMLQIYFERQESEALYSLISSFRTYLNRNSSISEAHRTTYRNFLNWASRIFRLSEWELKAQRDKLVDELAATPMIVEREWLLARINAPR